MTCLTCGKYHYSLDHYFKVHGNYIPEINNYRVQLPFKPNGKPFKADKYTGGDKPLPLITYKWCCKYCGRVSPNLNPKTHKADCAYIKYREEREKV